MRSESSDLKNQRENLQSPRAFMSFLGHGVEPFFWKKMPQYSRFQLMPQLDSYIIYIQTKFLVKRNVNILKPTALLLLMLN